ncbi:hypothetical protein B0H14DRAFT_3470200 [Mycena olivaceomarginata]|nr:hypothetical protein B0H14DRAFT_3470200 [Mycena olivaceomarginata]
MAKRKVLYVEEDDLNDGSDSDDSQEGYLPRTRGRRVHYIPAETITMGSRGVRSTMSSIPTPASPAKKTKVTLKPDVPAAPAFSFDDWEADYAEFDAEFGPGMQTTGPRKLRESDDPHGQWARLDREDFLDEVLRHDGRGDYIDQTVCAGPGCVKRLHASMPFHRIERWENGWFWRCTLKSLGVRIQLGHQVGEVCPNPSTAVGDDFVVITTQGIEEVGLDYCDCGTTKAKSVQLLRVKLYPATGTNPRSAATFASLRRFAHMTLESKCSPYEFYHSLVRETDNTGLEPSRDRYSEFLRMTRQWQHLLLLKRAGRGHDPCEDRIKRDKAGRGGTLVPCLPSSRDQLAAGLAHGAGAPPIPIRLVLAIDANFRLMRKDVSSEEKDPGLVRGWGFFGDVTKYMAHLEKHWIKAGEKHLRLPRCRRQNRSGVPGDGVIGNWDGRLRPPQYETPRMGYLNMDYLFFMSLAGCILLQLFVSYDIACQWYKNIWERMRIFDPHAQLKGGKTSVGFLVPNSTFQRTSRVHQRIRPGARRDTLEVHFQYWNWKKIMRLGHHLTGPPAEESPADGGIAGGMGRTSRHRSPASVIETWTAMARAWEADAEKAQSVRLRMAKIAADDVDHLRRALATVFKNVGQHETPTQGRARIERETKLRRKIDGWIAVQQLFIPEAALLRQREAAERDRIGATQSLPGIRAQDIKLWLPSAIGMLVQCDRSLLEYEYELRKGQAVLALNEIRSRLISPDAGVQHRGKVTGVRARRDRGRACPTSRPRWIVPPTSTALLELHSSPWDPRLQHRDYAHLQVLNAADVRGRPSAVFGDDDRRRKGGKRKKKARRMAAKGGGWDGDVVDLEGWRGATGEDQDVVENEALRIEWAKARAKAMRYAEETDLLEEEMRRVLQFFQWRADGWRARVGLRAARQDEALREGHGSYALKQAACQDGMACRF